MLFPPCEYLGLTVDAFPLPSWLVVLPYYLEHLCVGLLCYWPGAALVPLSAIELIAKRQALLLSKPGEQYW